MSSQRFVKSHKNPSQILGLKIVLVGMIRLSQCFEVEVYAMWGKQNGNGIINSH